MLRCDQFQISAAFITMGGVTPLLQTLKELEKKGVKGQILTTNYLNFSEPRALEKLNGLKNITLKMYDVEAAGNGFHTKGYIFKKEEVYRIIIGSSNMTSVALTVNKEWHVMEQSEYYGYSGDRVRGLVFCSRVTLRQQNLNILMEKNRYDQKDAEHRY